MTQNLITITQGVTRHPNYRLAEPLNLTIVKGQPLAICGPNGAGKSLLVDILTAAHPLLGDAMQVDFGGVHNNRMSDNIRLITFRDVYGGNEPAYYQQRWNQADEQTFPLVCEVLQQVANGTFNIDPVLMQELGVDALLNKPINQLSSGELRRMQLAKMLSAEPQMLIIDNPYIGLDKEAREQLTNLLQILSTEHSIQIMLVVNRTKDIPEFVSHVVEVSNMTVGSKMTRSEYMAQSQSADAPANIPDNWRQMIEQMAYKEEEYNAQRVVDMHKVSIRYGERTILKDLDWQVMNGEYWALTGRNGSGKSTLLSLVCADNPQSYACDITLFDKTRGSGESIWDIKKHIGYVSPEMHRAFRSNVTVERIVASGFSNAVSLYVKPDPQNHETCLKWMSIFGIEQLADKSFLKLSSGEQRLVLLARAMVKDPELLILDEPLHGLDEPNRRHVKQVIEAFCQRKGKTLIMVTHYEDELPACINHKKILYKNK